MSGLLLFLHVKSDEGSSLRQETANPLLFIFLDCKVTLFSRFQS